MSSPGPASPLVLSLRGVSKSYGAVQALREVSFECHAGEVHALVGENGSGKSTLLGIASGFVHPDHGEVEIGGQRRRRGSPVEARSLGLGMAYQTYSHVLELSVAENLFLAAPSGDQPSFGRMQEWAAANLAEFGLDLPVTATARSLSLANRQFLEVVKVLLARPKVLLLDEPTTALGPEEVERLHALVLEQSRSGVGIAYVSHRLPEVLGIADRVTVLRDGVGQGTFEAAAMSEEGLVALMIGRPLQLAFPERHDAREEREVLLAVSGLGGERFGPIDLDVAKGEIVGIAGAEGNGQVPFLRALAGAERATGSATCDGRELDTARRSGRCGRGRSAQRRPGRRGALPRPQRQDQHDDPGPAAARPPGLPEPAARASHRGHRGRLNIRMASIEQPVQSLSGGNQQKVSLTRPFLRGTSK